MSASQSPSLSTGVSSDLDSDNALTPSKKVQALLAQFDNSSSESESEKLIDRIKRDKNQRRDTKHPIQAKLPEAEDSDEDVLPNASRSRIAARLNSAHDAAQENCVEVAGPESEAKVSSQISSGIKGNIRHTMSAVGPTLSSDNDSSGPLRQPRVLLRRKKPTSPSEQSEKSQLSNPVSPLFFSSPNERTRTAHSTSSAVGTDSEELPDDPSSQSNSKFLALVEKHRRGRLEREAAEIAKKAAQAEIIMAQAQRKPRGSSPADNIEGDSDLSENGSATKLANEARPIRKASKRAVEEMNRETQRMSRNMHLAHQARTKKRITKESLLARFNFQKLDPEVETMKKNVGQSNTTSSAGPSDNGTDVEHTTPPTSPMQEETPEKAPLVVEPPPIKIYEDDALPVKDSAESALVRRMSLSQPKTDKGKARADDDAIFGVASTEQIGGHNIEAYMQSNYHRNAAERNVKSLRVKWTKEDAVMAKAGDSDSDLDIITSRGDTKKYAAFEHLSKRKAGETQSHRALRCLAHLADGNNKKGTSANIAEVEAALRRAARLQAREERQQKIEELKAKGVIIQTVEEREREQQEVEDLVERARQEASEIQKKEKQLAKKDGTYVKDDLDDDESDEDDDASFQDEDDAEDEAESGSDEDESQDEEAHIDVETGQDSKADHQNGFLDAEAEENESSEDLEDPEGAVSSDAAESAKDAQEFRTSSKSLKARRNRSARILSDEEDDDETQNQGQVENDYPPLPTVSKTPQSISRSARKQIPGLQMSDDLPMGLTQAFAATMADCQTQSTENFHEDGNFHSNDSVPSPNIAFAPRLNRLDSVDIVIDSQPASQVQLFSNGAPMSQAGQVPQSPVVGLGLGAMATTPSELHFEPTQDAGYMLSPFKGNRFATDTPSQIGPQSTADTVVISHNGDDSPLLQRKARLVRGRVDSLRSEHETDNHDSGDLSAFTVMNKAAKKVSQPNFDKAKSHARDIVDEAAEESEDEYAGIGGASDDDGNDEEDEEDRKMIDEDTQVGRGDEAKLAGLFADRERKEDEAAVSKLLKDITTGALRRKRGANDDLDLSDEEDAVARRQEAKRREFAKMRRELLKDEAVGKIAEDKKKEAFLRSIEDREAVEDGDDVEGDIDQIDTPSDTLSQTTQNGATARVETTTSKQGLVTDRQENESTLQPTADSKLNRLPTSLRRPLIATSKKPSTLAEIRESVSFLIEEPDSQSGILDLGLSDSEDEPEAYVNLDRHIQDAEEDENDDAEDLGDFIVDDEEEAADQEDAGFKKPKLPASRAPYNERRTKPRANIVNRLNLIRQASSSSSSSSNSSKLAFFTARSANDAPSKVPSLLRRATTNSSFGSMAGRRDETVSATGVVTSNGSNRTERGSVGDEKDFIRKGTGGRRNAVNYRPTVREEKMSQRAGVVKKHTLAKKGKKGSAGFLGGLFRGDSWS